MAAGGEILLRAPQQEASSGLLQPRHVVGGILIGGIAAVVGWKAWDVYDTYQLGLAEKAKRAAAAREHREKTISRAKKAATAGAAFALAVGVWVAARRISAGVESLLSSSQAKRATA